MVTAGEYQITKIVAVWRDADDTLYVVPPCGRCREFSVSCARAPR